MTQDHLPRRPFLCRFAAGEYSGAVSGIWRVWAARNRPELYIAIRSLGGKIKAPVHCPRPDRPTWGRHFGFVQNATGAVAEAVLAQGGSRHKITWTGANLAEEVSL